MTERILPGIGLTGYWDQGAPWKVGGDQNWLRSSVLTQLGVESATTSLPPSPLNGVIYIVPVGDVNANQVAARDNGAWVYMPPQEGWTAYVRDTGVLMNFDGAAWVPSTAPLAAPSGSTQIGTLQSAVGAVARTQQSKNTDVVSAQDFSDLIGDGVISASSVAQTVATLCDSGKKRYLHIANWGGDFKWDSTVSFTNPGVRIYGDQGATYNRGGGKEGWLTGQTGLTRFFDLGASRTTGNLADNWQVDGLSFKQAVGVAVRTIDGISFTTRTDGPDRGATLRGLSFIGLRDAITTENPDKQTVLANLSIESCVFQTCRSALNAKGNLLGLRFVGNQCEQNAPETGQGVLRGSINGAATITDNMLEGQPNVVSIDVPPTTGNAPHVLFAMNYLENNTGDYVIRFRSTSLQSSLTIGPNFIAGTMPQDFALIEGSSATRIENNDQFPVVFKNSNGIVKYGSRIVNKSVRSYGIRQLLAASSPEIVLAEFANLTDDQAAWVHALAPAGVTAQTPYGSKNVITDNTYIASTLSVAVGDLVCVNVLMRARVEVAGSIVMGINNESGVFLRGGGGQTTIAGDLLGRWALVSIPFVAQAAATQVRVRLLSSSGTYPRAIAGFTVRNFGAFANDATTRVLIEPVVPNV